MGYFEGKSKCCGKAPVQLVETSAHAAVAQQLDASHAYPHGHPHGHAEGIPVSPTVGATLPGGQTISRTPIMGHRAQRAPAGHSLLHSVPIQGVGTAYRQPADPMSRLS